MNISQTGIDLIKSFEGFRERAYDDLQPNKTITDESQVKGTLTIGYGYTANVKVGQVMTKAKAEELLKGTIKKYEDYVNSYVKVDLTQNMYDALVSFCYNVGGGNLKKSTLLELLNKKDYAGAAKQFLVWNKSKGQILQGLVKRRAAEAALFLKGYTEDKKETVAAPKKETETKKEETPATYKVKKGDALSKIAAKYNTTVKKLQDLNGISNPDLIQVGQVLKLTGSAPEKEYYKIKSGDALSKIAAKYHTSVKQLQDWNDISNPNYIQAGDTIRVK